MATAEREVTFNVERDLLRQATSVDSVSTLSEESLKSTFNYAREAVNQTADQFYRTFADKWVMRGASWGPQPLSEWAQVAQARTLESNALQQFKDQAVREAHRATDESLGAADPTRPFATRLHELINLASDEYPDTNIPSAVAIRALARLLSLGAARTGPGISLLPSGSIWLSWSTDHDQIGLVLLRDGSLAAGIVSREAARPTRINFSGQFSAVLQRIENEPLAHWITARQNLPP